MTKSASALAIVLSIVIIQLTPIDFASGQQNKNLELLFDKGFEHFKIGEYSQANKKFQEILDEAPENISTLRMNGITLSNLEQHKSSLVEFFKVLEIKADDVISLNGMGVGFGNLGEYQEAKKYFNKSLRIEPNNQVTKNYVEFIDRVIEKYPHTPTEKPAITEVNKQTAIPSWIKNNAGWWADDLINDNEFVSGIEYLISVEIIKVEQTESIKNNSGSIPAWIKQNAGWWASGQIVDEDFIAGLNYLINNGIISIDDDTISNNAQKEKIDNFEAYIDKILINISKEKRYIEYPNPSGDVIKKFLRDYIVWNFDQQFREGVQHFPEPEIIVEEDTRIIKYKIYVNEQPSGLPLDHVSTLNESLEFWKNATLIGNNNENVKIQFSHTKSKNEANVWVTWVVRNLGEGVLGHATLAKGVVEVALGDYSCDGRFQLYDVETVKNIMTHELGHSLGLGHSTNPNSIMYPVLATNYAYCLLDENSN